MTTSSHMSGKRPPPASRRVLSVMLLILAMTQPSEPTPLASDPTDKSSSKSVAAKLIKSLLKSSYTFLPRMESNSSSKHGQQLFRDYAIIRFRRKEKKLGLRWRSRKDVLSGKGKTVCGNEKCGATDGVRDKHKGLRSQLRNFEVKFGYAEQDQPKCALIKVKLCKRCGKKLRRGYGA
mmetsp:Transcript_7300/g.10024  ORF Transcript_7300/g.10024 Transcript_7300/m.10024 type:complete len:178 (-) Transcript_7300:244-777(-)|eukprot:CAMPEP_0185278908 /NCGR_PEP_ID=MMETSP1359-20130426/62204_1 /TAXON_ID=552665 /ORGANISM="Bigelowiella longifila, Strain CCMP242" /LENGTH=177 /DNA_ID=CAMNT_0027873595 /DNA_START=8 /DNA_END=541 /DNA_ORIENTATION=-